MRTDYCGFLTINNVGKIVSLCGWIDNIRILKNIIFIILRDYTGTIQIYIKKNNNIILWDLSLTLTIESCVKINGLVLEKKQKDKGLFTNSVEVLMYNILIFSYASYLPIDKNLNNTENIRLKYRYLDLRRPVMYNIFKIRSKVKLLIHNFLQNKKFLEIETPYLTKSSLEGARDCLVISDVCEKKFYALPQSPQIFKQLLMISCFDKYYQIVKCFRNENSRSDRQLEFTQIDIELSFSDFNFLSNLIEKLICNIWYEINNFNFNVPFKKISYLNALSYYGTDKPDLRNPLKFVNLSFLKYLYELSLNLNIIGFIIKYKHNNVIKMDLIFKFLKMNDFYDYFYIKITDITSNDYMYVISKNLSLDKKTIYDFFVKNNIVNGDIIFVFVLNLNKKYNLSNIRKFFAKSFNLIKKNKYYPVWIVDFPMFLIKNNKINAYHHPFTMPININIKELRDISNYNLILSSAYDLVINGYELGSGSARINDVNLQIEVFNILGISSSLQNKNYGFFLEALKYGVPPHLGIALGLDRIIMLLAKVNNIKDVIAFPKTSSGVCLLTNSPSIINC